MAMGSNALEKRRKTWNSAAAHAMSSSAWKAWQSNLFLAAKAVGF